MTEKRWLYFALGVTTVISIGAVTNQLVPLAPAAGMAVGNTGITFPDGTVQATAPFDVGSAARSHVLLRCEAYLPDGVKSTFGECGTVPPTKILVVESVSGSAILPVGQWVDLKLLDDDGSFLRTVHQLVTSLDHTDVDVDRYNFSQMIRLYFDEGEKLKVFFERSSPTGGAVLSYFVSGYYVDKLP